VPSARWWKAFYARERATLGDRGLAALLDRAPRVPLPRRGALVFPHAKLAGCGAQIAAAALAVLDSGAETVIALGVLHGARERDVDAVARARAGDPEARRALRGIHRDDGLAEEEFSLDAFAALLVLASRRAGRDPPRMIARYPFLVGAEAASLAGLDEVRALVDSGAVLVATADHVHHGAAYGTPARQRIPLQDARAEELARAAVDEACGALARGDASAFTLACASAKSDFRDPGPVLAALLPQPWCHRLDALALVDYAADLGAEPPSWVAAALVACGAPPELGS
jgi:hypothetical protein